MSLLKFLIDKLSELDWKGVKFGLEIVTLWSPNHRKPFWHKDQWSTPRWCSHDNACQEFLSTHLSKWKKKLCYHVLMKYECNSIRHLLSSCLNQLLCMTWVCNIYERSPLLPLSDQSGDFDYEGNQTSQCGPVAWGILEYLQSRDHIDLITFWSSISLGMCAFDRLWLAKQIYTWFLNFLTEASYLIRL
jgi:hypothetical protein